MQRLAFTQRSMTILVTCLLVLGCSRPSDQPVLVPVTGTVTLDGTPVENAMIRFSPQTGRPSVAMTDAEGGYHLRYSESEEGAVVGRHQVSITTGRPAITRGGKMVEAAIPETIPDRYNSQTTLTADVDPSQHQFDFSLQSK